ncbi:hypothetical protein [Nitrosomonas sp. Nm166]|uniref:hypothetical protein n=1 Tax=Nitrosomonas sp. Nm166 TaxID=1881054 RepID=UPI0008EF780D|nr:hypothetical protein [Nitrosomonas sp. Nm166]SFE85681.1 hypothetical protein SAMN05428977_103318 [Nitrosomonas sp. Nm166]
MNKTIAAQDGVPGYILSRTTEKNHRPVAFVFAGDAQEEDGAQVFLRSNRLEDSVNYKSTLAGLAYPTYYTGLFSDLRKKVTSAVDKARKGGKGIWPKDKTTQGFTVSSLASVTDDEVCSNCSAASSTSWAMAAASMASKTILLLTRTRWWN